MGVEIKPLKASPNWTILNAIKNAASTDYQNRVPDATKANIAETVKAMWDYAPTRNEFIDAFINRIGMTIARNLSWSNPLSEFKIGMLEYGDTIEEYVVGLLTAKTYDASRDGLEKDIWGQETPDVQTSFHKVNRENYYKVTVNEAILKRAFLTSNGLSSVIVQIMQAPTTSDNWDEFLLTCSLFKTYYDNEGFFKVNVPDVTSLTSDSADSKAFIRRIREYVTTLGFISTNYNAAHMPIAATPDELHLFITPEALAATDVEALAAAFNLPYTEFGVRYTVIPKEHMDIVGAQAILTTRDFFVIADQRMETTSIANPVGLYSNYFFHHWQVISASRFVPAILFTSTEATTDLNVIAPVVTGIGTPVIYNGDTSVHAGTELTRGSLYIIDVSATTDPADGANSAVQLELFGALSERTFINQNGVTYISPDESATALVVKMTAQDNTAFTAELPLTVSGELVRPWPDPAVFPDADTDGLVEVTPTAVPAAPTSGADKNKVTIPDADGFDYKDGSAIVTGKTITLTANKTITAVAHTGFEFSTGATTTWNLVYTA